LPIVALPSRRLPAELNMLQGSPQQRFAMADLAAVNRTLTPFVVAMWHRGMYVACKEDDNGEHGPCLAWSAPSRCVCPVCLRNPGLHR
jgi:hypothetical protein